MASMPMSPQQMMMMRQQQQGMPGAGPGGGALPMRPQAGSPMSPGAWGSGGGAAPMGGPGQWGAGGGMPPRQMPPQMPPGGGMPPRPMGGPPPGWGGGGQQMAPPPSQQSNAQSMAPGAAAAMAAAIPGLNTPTYSDNGRPGMAPTPAPAGGGMFGSMARQGPPAPAPAPTSTAPTQQSVQNPWGGAAGTMQGLPSQQGGGAPPSASPMGSGMNPSQLAMLRRQPMSQ